MHYSLHAYPRSNDPPNKGLQPKGLLRYKLPHNQPKKGVRKPHHCTQRIRPQKKRRRPKPKRKVVPQKEIRPYPPHT
uniref:Uncharacterized protein n=1 Tax=uncultured Bacteroidota bacterium TaxID=152509 RepID=H5SK62_9BACT|nr:hypothetical protein HGMM_F40B03C36 [uncultured Bacteroidetes bacterium]